MRSRHPLTFGSILRTSLVGLGLAALAACSNPAERWVKPGVTNAQRDADFAGCRAEARAESGERVDQDVQASRAAQGHGPTGPDAAPGSTASRDSEISSQALIACMTDHGYHGG
jgi:hypothetical protein